MYKAGDKVRVINRAIDCWPFLDKDKIYTVWNSTPRVTWDGGTCIDVQSDTNAWRSIWLWDSWLIKVGEEQLYLL